MKCYFNDCCGDDRLAPCCHDCQEKDCPERCPFENRSACIWLTEDKNDIKRSTGQDAAGA